MIKNQNATEKLLTIKREIEANYVLCEIGMEVPNELTASFYRGASTELRGLYKILTGNDIDDEMQRLNTAAQG